MANAMLIDTSKCTGCRSCQVACKQWNQLPTETKNNKNVYPDSSFLSARTWTNTVFKESIQKDELRWFFTKIQCMHCMDATCVKVCPTGAARKTDQGAVIIDQKKCSGCQFCVQNCQFEVPKYDKKTNTAKKCSLCYDRIAVGLDPACAKTCPSGAVQFGQQDQLKSKGQEKVTALVNKGYKKANLYGADGKGKDESAVLYILADEPTSYGLPANPKVPASVVLWQDILKPAGAIAGGATVIALLVSFFAGLKYQEEENQGSK